MILLTTLFLFNAIDLLPEKSNNGPEICIETVLDALTGQPPTERENFNSIFLGQKPNKTVMPLIHSGAAAETSSHLENQAIELFKRGYPNKQNSLRVEAPGSIGLVTAMKLTQLGYKVIEISTKTPQQPQQEYFEDTQ